MHSTDSTQLKPRTHFQRFEFKYYLDLSIIDDLTKDLLRFMRWDPYVAELRSKSYTITSLYYDSPSLGYYYEKIDGMSRRKKIRWRTYASERGAGAYFCEIKRKFDMVTMKDRIIADPSDRFRGMSALDQMTGTRQKEAKAFLDEIIIERMLRSLQPQVLVRYDRSPLIGIYEDRLRITLDSNIWAAKTSEETMKSNAYEPVLTNGAILEVKYNNSLPFWFLALVRRYDLSRIAYSKYARSIETVHKLLTPEVSDILPTK